MSPPYSRIMGKIQKVILSVILAGICLPVLVLAQAAPKYKIENIKTRYDGKNTIVTGKITTSEKISDHLIYVKFSDRAKPSNVLTFNTGKNAALGNFSVTILDFKIPAGYLTDVYLQKNSKPEILSVRFANLPRNASEGVYTGEKIAIVWSARNMPADATMTIMMYPINEGGKKGTPTILATSEPDDGLFEFNVPTGLLKTTEPDYKPYMASVQYQNTTKDAEGFIYIKHIGCPIFSFFDPLYENTSLVQKVSIIDPGDAVTGNVGLRLFEYRNNVLTRDPIEWDSGNRIKVDFSNAEFSIKTKSQLDSNSKYYGYLRGDFWDANGDLLECVARRFYFLTPKNFYLGQKKTIEVLPVAEAAKTLKAGDKITAKWQTLGIGPKERVYIRVSEPKDLIYKKGYSRPPGTPVVNNGLAVIKIPSVYKDMLADVQVAFQDSETKSIIRGVSKGFYVGKNKCPIVTINSFEPRYYGLVVEATLENPQNYKNAKIWFNSKRLRNDSNTFPGENEQNMYDDGKTYKDIGFNSEERNFDPKTNKATIYFPRNETKNYPGKILFRPNSHYLAVFYFSSDKLEAPCQVAAFDYWSKSDRGVSPASVTDLGYVMLDKNTFEVSGQVDSQGFSEEGVVPYVEVTASQWDYDEGTEGKNFVFYAKGSKELSPKKVKEGNRFYIRAFAPEIDLSKSSWLYRLCAKDAGDSFMKMSNNCRPFSALPIIKGLNLDNLQNRYKK